MTAILGFLCWVAAAVIFVLLALSTITDGSYLYWGLGLVAGGVVLRSIPAVKAGSSPPTA
jgi:hypothetical protein